MAISKTKFKTIDDYIGTFPEDVQEKLERLRQTIKNAVPEAEETISYNIPTFTLNGRYLIYFAGYRNHIALYPAPRPTNREFADKLSRYLGKGTRASIRLPIDEAIPSALVNSIVKARVAENLASANKK
jgi:uncharacterized protein YdhG (YjbR/CyaY superfamily)